MYWKLFKYITSYIWFQKMSLSIDFTISVVLKDVFNELIALLEWHTGFLIYSTTMNFHGITHISSSLSTCLPTHTSTVYF